MVCCALVIFIVIFDKECLDGLGLGSGSGSGLGAGGDRQVLSSTKNRFWAGRVSRRREGNGNERREGPKRA